MRKSTLLLLGWAMLAAPAAAQSRPGDAAPTARDIPHVNHVVQPNETLFGIAERYYGNGYQYPLLEEANPWVDPDRLIVGEKIFVPNPKHTYSVSSSNPNGSLTTENPNYVPGPGPSLGRFFDEFRTANIFGVSLIKAILFLFVWFVVHAAIQGSFVWFAAHLSFVKNVSFAKAMRATVQSESLATALLIVVSLTGLAMVYVGTSPPGKPALGELLGTVESYLSSDTGMATVGILMVMLYGFLGVRFIPQAFEIPGAQGWAVVVLAVIVPHLIFLYLLGNRLGFIG